MMPVKVIIYIGQDDKTRLERLAKEEGLALSAVMRGVVKRLLAQDASTGKRPVLDAGPAIPLAQEIGREAHYTREGE